VRRLADRGLAALSDDAGFAKGVNTYSGAITCQAVADALGRTDVYHSLTELS